MAKADRKKTAPRTDAELMKGSLKEKLYFLVRNAYRLAGGAKNYAQNSFKGIAQLEGSKLPSAVFQRAAHPDSPYWGLADGDARIKAFRDKVAKAQDDIANERYTKAVQDAVSDFIAIKGEYAQRGGGGARTISSSLVSSVKI